MAARKSTKRSTKRATGPQFLVVRGTGNTYFVALAGRAFKNPKVARALDTVVKESGAIKARRAFVVKGEKALKAMCPPPGIHFGRR